MRYGQQGTPIYPIGLPGGGFAPMQGYAIPGYMPYGVPPQGYPGMGPGGQGGFQMMPGMMGGPGGGPGGVGIGPGGMLIPGGMGGDGGPGGFGRGVPAAPGPPNAPPPGPGPGGPGAPSPGAGLPPPRERKVIRIVDPTTNEAIDLGTRVPSSPRPPPPPAPAAPGVGAPPAAGAAAPPAAAPAKAAAVPAAAAAAPAAPVAAPAATPAPAVAAPAAPSTATTTPVPVKRGIKIVNPDTGGELDLAAEAVAARTAAKTVAAKARAAAEATAAAAVPVAAKAAPPAAAAPAAEEDDWEAVKSPPAVAPAGVATPAVASLAAPGAGGPAPPPIAAPAPSPDGRKVYSRDWLMMLASKCPDPPEGMEFSEVLAPGWRERSPPPMAMAIGGGMGGGYGGGAGAGGGGSGGRHGGGGGPGFDGPRRAPPGGGPMGGAGPMGGGPMGGGDDRWKQRGPPGGGPPPGMMGGRGGGPPGVAGRGGGARGGPVEGDRWARGQALPPMPGAAMGGRRNPSLHKADSRYVIGTVDAEDPGEAKKQREFKAHLNKITPEKYATIRDKILAVGVDSEKTLTGLIDQVFDKALGEPTFCEVYASLCYDLNQAVPGFDPAPGALTEEGAPAPPITFRRLLVNKCQAEFEVGVTAIKAVDAREKKAADDAAAGPGEVVEDEAGDEAAAATATATTKGKDGSEESAASKPASEAGEEDGAEEGELPAEPEKPLTPAEAARAVKLAEAREAEAELKARRRMLGNIQFIGQLYQQKMLTERIMHACIQQLLENVDNPKREDMECLCKLMTTIGALLDGSSKSKPLMDMYFKRVAGLATSPALDSRMRFLLLDVVELRRAHWVARRKVEGPKTIDEIHRDARDEAIRRAADDRRGPGGPGGGRPGGRDSRGPPEPARRPRYEERVDAPIRAMHRNASQELMGPASLRPGGPSAGFARAVAGAGLAPRAATFGRSGPPAGRSGDEPGRPTPRADEGEAATPVAAAAEAGEPAAPAPAAAAAAVEEGEPAPPASGEPLDADAVRAKARTLVREFQELHDPAEVDATCGELAAGGADGAAVLDALFEAAYDVKGLDRGAFQTLVLAVATRPAFAPGAAPGFRRVLDALDEAAVDAPFAPALVGGTAGALAAFGGLDLAAFGADVLAAGAVPPPEGEDADLVAGGTAAKVMAAALRGMAAEPWEVEEGAEEGSAPPVGGGAGPPAAAAAWAASGLDLKAFLPSADRDNAAELDKVVAEFDIAGVLEVGGA
jgi:translation initiation factor 4G